MFHTQLKVFVYILFAFVGSCSCYDTYLYDDSGIITSPNYPSDYPNYSDRAWLILVTPGNTITLTFSNFNLESDSECLHDYVEVREDSKYGNSLTGKMCGTAGLSRTVTSTSSLYVIFRTDGSGTRSGFRAKYDQSGSTYTAHYCSFTHTSKYCTYGCCYSRNDCCTLDRVEAPPTIAPPKIARPRWGWLIGVIVGSCVVGLSITSLIICCIVKAAKRAPQTTVFRPVPQTTVFRPVQPQPCVTVVSTGQQGTAAANPGIAYPNYYAPPGAMPPPYYYNNPENPPQATTAQTSEKV